MTNKFDNITKTIEFTAKELAIMYSLVGHASTLDMNKKLSEYKPTDHTSHLFEPIGTTTDEKGYQWDEALILFRKLKAQMDAIREETKPVVKVIYYYIAQQAYDDFAGTFVSNAFDSYEQAEDNFNKILQDRYNLIEIVRKEITI